MMKKIRMGLVTGVLGLCVFFLGAQSIQAATMIPDFTLTEAKSGQMVDSNTFNGKARLVIFFATWCPPCMEEVTVLKQLQHEYLDQDFTIVALSVDQRVTDVQRFLDRRGVTYPVLMADRAVIKAFGGIPGVPVTFLVNKKGQVLRKYPGYVPHKLLDREVQKMLAE